MAQITLKFDARNQIAKKTIDYILSIGVFTTDEINLNKPARKTAIDASLEDIKKGRVNKYKNVKELFSKVLS